MEQSSQMSAEQSLKLINLIRPYATAVWSLRKDREVISFFGALFSR